MKRSSTSKNATANASSSRNAKQYVTRFFMLPYKQEHLDRPRLPNVFAHDHKNGVVGVCMIHTPDGSTYSVKVTANKDGLYLEEGWTGFHRQYTIAKGHVIMFHYMGSAHFNVNLFDFNLTEICYVRDNPVKPEPEDDYMTSHPTRPLPVDYKARFFTILQPHHRLHKLRLPNSFTAKYKREVLGECTLNTPDGTKHKVVVTTIGKQLFIAEGWATLCDKYGVLVGYLIVLQYSGDAKFDLIIFDISTTEIKYNTAMPIERRLKGQFIYNSAGNISRANTPFVSGRSCFTIILTQSCLQRNGQLWIPKTHREQWLDSFDGNQVRLIHGF